MTDDFTFETCEPCVAPQRHVGCRATCPGWQFREEQKRKRYADNTTAFRSIPDHEHTKRAKNKSAVDVSRGFRRRDR